MKALLKSIGRAQVARRPSKIRLLVYPDRDKGKSPTAPLDIPGQSATRKLNAVYTIFVNTSKGKVLLLLLLVHSKQQLGCICKVKGG
jgi:hypothetical protein